MLEGHDNELRRAAMGKLIYMSIARRDLKYAAKALVRHMHQPRRSGRPLAQHNLLNKSASLGLCVVSTSDQQPNH